MNEQTELRLSHKDNEAIESIQPNPAFAEALETQLRQMHAERYPAKRHNYLNTHWQMAVASIVLVCIMVMALPPTRTFAVQMVEFFFRSASDTITVQEGDGFALEPVEVNTVDEAEAIAGFEMNEWVNERYALRFVFADTGHINLVYEQIDDGFGSLVHVSQTLLERADTNAFDAIPPDVDIVTVTVNQNTAYYVEGYWFSYVEDGDSTFRWVDDHYQQLQWMDDTYSYHLLIASDVVQSAEDAVMIAESLQTLP